MYIIKNNEVKEITLEDLKGQKSILFFYPRANTPGWVYEAQDFSGLKSEFDKLGYELIGASRDSVEKQQKFIKKRDLNMAIISDEDSVLCNHFNVIKEKTVAGKTVSAVSRTTIVIDENLNIVKRYDNVKIKGHASEVLEDLQ